MGRVRLFMVGDERTDRFDGKLNGLKVEDVGRVFLNA